MKEKSKGTIQSLMKTKSRFFLPVLILLITTACISGQPNTNVNVATANAPQEGPVKLSSATGTYFSINEVGLGPNGFVALTNFTDVPASLAGLYLCQGSSCFELPDTVVPAGGIVRISVGDGSGYENVVVTHAALGELRPSDGEIALLTSKNLDELRAVLVYFQWGSTPHELTQTAVEAGLWVAGGYGPSSQNATRLYRVEESGLWLFEE